MLFNILLSGSGNLAVNILMFVFVFAALIAALTIHEFAHAYVADKLGDSTARGLGRLTLRPEAHIDPMGLLFLLFTGFGWGKPVPFNPALLKSPRRDSALIALAGPVSNILLAIALALIYQLFSYLSSGTFILFGLIQVLIKVTIQYNLVLAIFNLIPVEPLDGFKIVAGILPEELVFQWFQMRQYGIWILLVLVMTGTTEKIIRPFLAVAARILGI
jgi:Zn-dependent protease